MSYGTAVGEGREGDSEREREKNLSVPLDFEPPKKQVAAGVSEIMGQRKQGPEAGSIPGETAVCSGVKFNHFPTVRVRFCHKMRQKPCITAF